MTQAEEFLCAHKLRLGFTEEQILAMDEQQQVSLVNELHKRLLEEASLDGNPEYPEYSGVGPSPSWLH